jgi:hypothetical protein
MEIAMASLLIECTNVTNHHREAVHNVHFNKMRSLARDFTLFYCSGYRREPDNRVSSI